MPDPFLVYELTADRPSWGRRDRWSSREHGRDLGGPNVPNLPVGLKADLLGCFEADDETDACTLAAQAVQRPGSFLAIKGAHRVVTFNATKDKDALTRLRESSSRHLCGCHGLVICDAHRVMGLEKELMEARKAANPAGSSGSRTGTGN